MTSCLRYPPIRVRRDRTQEKARTDDRPALGPLKDHTEAVLAAETALARDPEDIANKLLLAEALLLGADLDRAETEVRDILQRAPGTVEAHQILAKVMLEQADIGDGDLYEQAIVELDRAWTLAGTANASKTASPALGASVHYLRGFARSKIYDDPKLAKDESLILAARDGFRRCLTFDPQNHRAIMALRKIEERLKPRSAGGLAIAPPDSFAVSSHSSSLPSPRSASTKGHSNPGTPSSSFSARSCLSSRASICRIFSS